MGIEKNLSVHGSVIQRSIVPEGLGAVLNIATVPVAELDTCHLDSNSSSNFRRLVGQVIGIPTESILSEDQYGVLSKQLLDGKIWKEMSSLVRDPYTDRMFHMLYYYWREFTEYQHDERQTVTFPDKHTELLGLHSLALMMSPTGNSGISWPVPFPFHILMRRDKSKWLDELQITEEAFQLGLSCHFSSLLANDRVSRFTKAAGNYDIPSGQSPAIRSDNLKSLIETSKKVCLAPLAVGGTTAISQLSQCNYVAALLATGTGAAMTLILVGTVSVADYLVHYLLHKRNSLGSENGVHQRLER